jgi:transposase-like protein
MPVYSNDDSWAVTEFADAELGDARRTQRVIALATGLAQRPGASLPAACGDDARLQAASRFCDNAAIEPQDLLDSHIGATFPRVATVPLVLAVQDTTELDWTAHPATTGLGPLGHPAPRGLLVHTTLAFTPERVPWGLLAQQVWARAPDDVGKRATRKQRPIAEQASQQWLTRVAAVLAARRACPQTRFVSVGDREADVYDLLAMERPTGVDLLIRAAWDRCVPHAERSVWATVAAQPVEATTTVQVPRPGPAAPADGDPGGAVVSADPVPAGPPQARAASNRATLGGPSPRGGASRRDGPHGVAVADDVCRSHRCRGPGAPGLVCVSLGGGSLAENFAKRLSHRSPPVGNRRAAATLSAAL